MRLKTKSKLEIGKKTGRKFTTVVAATALACTLSFSSAKADITGFGSDNISLNSYPGANPGGGTTLTGTTSPSWTINSINCCSGNAVSIDASTSTLTLGGGDNYNGGSAFANTQQSTADGWTASFTFDQAIGVSPNQLTWAFVVQNDPRGAQALDYLFSGDVPANGSPITPSAEVVFANGGSDLNVGFLNNTGTGTPAYNATTFDTSLTFTGGAITADLSYSGTTLTLNLIQGSNTYTTSETVDIPTLVGTSSYVGFDANRMDQGVTINNFSFTAASVPEPSTMASAALGLMVLLSIMRLRRQSMI
jgi:hypothetical protein